LPDGQITLAFRPSVQSIRLKYFTFAIGQIIFRTFPRPAPVRGAFRDRHERWARDAMDAGVREDEALSIADGEVVAF